VTILHKVRTKNVEHKLSEVRADFLDRRRTPLAAPRAPLLARPARQGNRRGLFSRLEGEPGASEGWPGIFKRASPNQLEAGQMGREFRYRAFV